MNNYRFLRAPTREEALLIAFPPSPRTWARSDVFSEAEYIVIPALGKGTIVYRIGEHVCIIGGITWFGNNGDVQNEEFLRWVEEVTR